ncbi:E3 ubiquitin-protein ligase TRAIP-like [Leptopilina boulardi]|uniref:E3 ubiquitin-protein ligase TRAIP-like n=1 Tax=Leptopilina boulardi TaxID=63433 RepID=UPI0021F51027|nr:E3 ubiquitin-protein ligase TRAIP-like [Leptopilina boulardi]
MYFSCEICTELLLPTEELFSTLCGHIFHFPCLTKWLERSKTCPHCREKVSQAKIHRLYFNFSNNDSISEDSTTLQSRVENLEFKLLMKDMDIKQYISQAEELRKQIPGFRKEIERIETELTLQNVENFSLKEQVQLLMEKNKNIEELQARSKRLDELRKKNLQEMLAISEKKRLDLEKQFEIYNKNMAISDTQNEPIVVISSEEREKSKVELVRKLSVNSNEGVSTAKILKPTSQGQYLLDNSIVINDDDLVIRSSKPSSRNTYLLGSPIVISEDSSDEETTSNATRGNKENAPNVRLRSKRILLRKEKRN